MLTRQSDDCNAKCKREHEAYMDGLRSEQRDKAERWDERWGNLRKQCGERENIAKAHAQCQARFTPQCNPEGLTQDSCVQKK